MKLILTSDLHHCRDWYHFLAQQSCEAPLIKGGSWIWNLGKTICFNVGQSRRGEPPWFIELEIFSAKKWNATWYSEGKPITATSP